MNAQELEAAMKELDAIAADCAEDNWDGDGAMAVSERSVVVAKDLLRQLTIQPDPGADPRGHVTLGWYYDDAEKMAAEIEGLGCETVVRRKLLYDAPVCELHVRPNGSFYGVSTLRKEPKP